MVVVTAVVKVTTLIVVRLLKCIFLVVVELVLAKKC